MFDSYHVIMSVFKFVQEKVADEETSTKVIEVKSKVSNPPTHSATMKIVLYIYLYFVHLFLQVPLISTHCKCTYHNALARLNNKTISVVLSICRACHLYHNF